MPIYDYACECGNEESDIFHKTKEEIEAGHICSKCGNLMKKQISKGTSFWIPKY